MWFCTFMAIESTVNVNYFIFKLSWPNNLNHVKAILYVQFWPCSNYQLARKQVKFANPLCNWRTRNPEPPFGQKQSQFSKCNHQLQPLHAIAVMCNHLLAGSKDLPGFWSLLQFGFFDHPAWKIEHECRIIMSPGRGFIFDEKIIPTARFVLRLLLGRL